MDPDGEAEDIGLRSDAAVGLLSRGRREDGDDAEGDVEEDPWGPRPPPLADCIGGREASFRLREALNESTESSEMSNLTLRGLKVERLWVAAWGEGWPCFWEELERIPDDGDAEDEEAGDVCAAPTAEADSGTGGGGGR